MKYTLGCIVTAGIILAVFAMYGIPSHETLVEAGRGILATIGFVGGIALFFGGLARLF